MSHDRDAASDALSLHTIAGDPDAYAAQEQEDVDFAVALQLAEEEDGEDVTVPPNRMESSPKQQVSGDNVVPYRDDANVGEDQVLPRYRDDPDAAPDEDEEAQQLAITPVKKRRFCLRRPAMPLQRLKAACKRLPKLPWRALVFCAILLGVVLGGTFLVMHMFRTSAKELAWRASKSYNYDLKLPRLYPALESGASDDCKETWEKYAASLSCHEQILSTAWDDGDAEEVRRTKVDPWAYSEWICRSDCLRSIRDLATPLSNGCGRRADRFDVESYGKDGKMYFEIRELPDGPMDAQKRLLERYDRLCKEPPRHLATVWGTCAADVWMKWGVVDGRNEVTMKGVAAFRDATSKKKNYVDGTRLTGSVKIVDGEKKYDFTLPPRKVGPGVGETSCGYCTVDWLVRKMRAFEYGQMMDPGSDKPLNLAEFDALVTETMMRCEDFGMDEAINDVHSKWEKYGWWCGSGPCHTNNQVSDTVRTLLHGLRQDDTPLPQLRRMSEQTGGPKELHMTLHDSLQSLPCSIWFSEHDAQTDIVPSHYLVHHLCSDHCRNAIDRLDQQHGAKFAAAAAKHPSSIFESWQGLVEQVDTICTNLYPGSVVQDTTPFCAPGYAAVGHPEWAFRSYDPPKSEILNVFAAAVDDLARKHPSLVPKPDSRDVEALHVLVRTMTQSVCNACSAVLFVGRNPDGKTRVDEFLDDDAIDGREYTRAAKKWFVTCAKMMGLEFSFRQERKIWEKMGLDRYDYDI
ncbi:hypothetical protein BDW02DRAFT_208821 [Decorospora gaudefroyi]|uniref:Uncharacterized protein n=1 Tax=Decorospora gaudefroyi TaxID=184978 RepID=A0A6A5KQX3_9PLEO|nr:hypothetical protein BDW02DRAFT_208821 [Decorospora gaudefroyi]